MGALRRLLLQPRLSRSALGTEEPPPAQAASLSLDVSTGRDWATVSADRFLGWTGVGPPAEGRWRIGRPSTRPVLKHGPRSLTCARVVGSYETRRRSESEGRPRTCSGGIPPRSAGGAHHRPVSSALSVRRSRSVHVGTRKMVNYA